MGNKGGGRRRYRFGPFFPPRKRRKPFALRRLSGLYGPAPGRSVSDSTPDQKRFDGIGSKNDSIFSACGAGAQTGAPPLVLQACATPDTEHEHRTAQSKPTCATRIDSNVTKKSWGNAVIRNRVSAVP